MRTLNLGILAHVDAGKTTLTERLLYAAGVIDEIGSVDEGSTQTDSLELERQRGITIKSAVVSFVIDDVSINLIDTPGHPDFIAEVERVLNVLDGAVLVISAVEGVQAQTRVLMRTLQRLRIPTLLFVNKIDRGGAQHEPLLRSIAGKLTPSIIAMGSTRDLGTRHAASRRTAHPTARSSAASRTYSRNTMTRSSRPTSTNSEVCSTRICAARSLRSLGGRWYIRSSSARRSPARAWIR
jgi:ribosomal protection tetracycline resistance protein